MNGIVDFAKTVAASAWMNAFAARGAFAPLKDRTAILTPDALPRALCAELIARIDAIACDPLHPRIWRDPEGSDTRIFGFERDIEDEIETFELDRRIEAVDAYLGLKTRSWFLMANRVLPKPGNLGSGGGLHRDSPFSHQVKCIWYLSDVGPENGPFQYVPGSHFDLIKKRDAYPLGQDRFERTEDELVEVCAPAGSLLVCDTKCVHRGKPIERGARYAVTLYTYPREDGARRIFERTGLDPATVREAA